MWNQHEEAKTSRPAGSQPAPAAHQKTEENQRTTARIGKSVVIKGNVISAEDLTIDGRVEGTIELWSRPGL